MIDERLASARIAALFSVARPAYLATLANAALLLVVVWGAFSHVLLIGWAVLLAALTLGRAGLHRSYDRRPAARTPQQWERMLLVGAACAGALWALPPAVLLPQSEPLL